MSDGKLPWCPTCGWGAPCVEEPVTVIRERLEEARRQCPYPNEPKPEDFANDDIDTGDARLVGEIEGLLFALRALGVEP